MGNLSLGPSQAAQGSEGGIFKVCHIVGSQVSQEGARSPKPRNKLHTCTKTLTNLSEGNRRGNLRVRVGVRAVDLVYKYSSSFCA